MSLQETSLIEKSKNGDMDSFEQLIVAHQKRAFNIAYRILNNIEDANDVTQEALLKAYRGIQKFNGNSSFATWLYTIVSNTCMDYLKKNRKHNLTYLDRMYDSEDGKYILEIQSDEDSPEEILEKKEVKEIVNEAIDMLGEEHRKIIVLRDLQQFSYEEIATILNCSEGTVKSRISRARNNLKKLLKDKIEHGKE